MSDLLLDMKGIGKSFPGVRALDGVDFSVKRGEIVCLLGENGAGKSTLMKILAGVYTEHEGTIMLDGRSVRLSSTRDATEHGIGIVFQEFNLCPNLTAAENLFLGNEVKNRLGLIDYTAMRRKAEAAFRRLGVQVPLDARAGDLGVAQQQMIEVAKALAHNTRMLIMDEPTSALADTEIAQLFRLMKDLQKRGMSIIFISHKLPEVLHITDRVVCLKDGRNSGEVDTKKATEETLVSMMVGRDIACLYAKRTGTPSTDVAFEARHISGPPHIRDVSFRLHRGEILGLAGLVGAGRTELAKLLMGAVRRTAGTIMVYGRHVRISHPADAVAHGIGYASEDRKQLGLILPMTARENISMTVHHRILNKLGLISAKRENRLADDSIKRLRIKVSSREQVARNLSGGNQQKLVIAKWLAIKPKVLILDEPTRGIDVGAKAEVHKIIADLADNGVAVIVISSELPEILNVADRVLVMHEGRVTADIPRAEADEETIMKAAVA